MHLYGTHTPGGVRVYDDKLPPLLSAEESFQLWLELKAAKGSIEILNTIIDGNTRIAAAIASRYAVSMKWQKEDLFGEALLGLATCSQNLVNMEFVEPGALRGYLRKSIHGYLGTYITRCISGFAIDPKQISRVKNGTDGQYKTVDEIPKFVPMDGTETLTVAEGREHLIDRMERLMTDAGLEEIEYKVMMFYLAGYSEEDTAKELGHSKSKVHYRKTEAIEKIRYIFFDSESGN